MSILGKEKLNEANRLIFVKQYEKADRLLAEYVATPVGQVDMLAHLRRAELAQKLDNRDRLRGDYAKQLATNSESVVAHYGLAILDLYAGERARAESEQVFVELLKRFGPTAIGYYGLGYVMEAEGTFERALFNYEKSVACDKDFAPSYFGLSQVCYQQGDDKGGDQYFYLFEKIAPFNIYGNFETHRQIAYYFLDQGDYMAAETALTTLSEWWIEQKGSCPIEIQIHEMFTLSEITKGQGDPVAAEGYRARGRVLSQNLLSEEEPKESVLFFVAKVLDDKNEKELALAFYKKTLRLAGDNPAVVQKIGGHFLAQGDIKLARELFDEAVQWYPENRELGFCRLIAGLKEAGVDVESYLTGRERMRELMHSGAEKVELLAVLHALLAKYQRDGEVHGNLADVYRNMGHLVRAEQHLQKMFEFDGYKPDVALKYAGHMIDLGQIESANLILKRFAESANSSTISGDGTSPLNTAQRAEMDWLRSRYFAAISDHGAAMDLVHRNLARDPWHIGYLTQAIISLSHLAQEKFPDIKADSSLNDMLKDEQANVDWVMFDQQTQIALDHFQFELAYTRQKYRFVFGQGGFSLLYRLVEVATQYDVSRGTYDIMRLLNTNFDGPMVYWALGLLTEEQWELETATMWFEQALIHPELSETERQHVYVHLADCYTWRGRELGKAIEYAKIALDLGQRQGGFAATVLAHAYLKQGHIREAQAFLSHQDTENDPEARYLAGLIHYRNGSTAKANQVWKPLLTTKVETRRFHNIKQEVLKYYFEKSAYLQQAN